MDAQKMRSEWVKKNFKARVACECGTVFPCIVTKEEWHDKKCIVLCEHCGAKGEKKIIGLLQLDE